MSYFSKYSVMVCTQKKHGVETDWKKWGHVTTVSSLVLISGEEFFHFVADACKQEILSSWKKSLCFSQNFPQQCAPLQADFTWCEEIFSLLVLCLLNFLAISFQEWLCHDTSEKTGRCLRRTVFFFFFLIIGNHFH